MNLDNFEIDLPVEDSLSLSATDGSLYSYDFSSFSLVHLQNEAAKSVNKSIMESLLSNISTVKLIEKSLKQGKTEYVAKITDEAKKKISTGEWSIGIKKKTGELFSVIKDTKSGKTKGIMELDKRIVSDLGNLPELSAIQGQLASISEEIDHLNEMIQRVELGQYNDRFSGFFAARQMIIEGLLIKDDFLKKSLLINAVQSNNETIAKLTLSIHHDGLTLADPKTKSKDAKRIEALMQSSLMYLNSSVQLNLVAYTALREEAALFSTLTNYHSYIKQDLLKENEEGRSIAWLIDNGHSGDDGKILNLTNGVSNKIQGLIVNYLNNDIKEIDYGTK